MVDTVSRMKLIGSINCSDEATRLTEKNAPDDKRRRGGGWRWVVLFAGLSAAWLLTRAPPAPAPRRADPPPNSFTLFMIRHAERKVEVDGAAELVGVARRACDPPIDPPLPPRLQQVAMLACGVVREVPSLHH